MASVDPGTPSCRTRWEVYDYNLAATLDSGQAFRWHLRNGWWEGVIGKRWVRLRDGGDGLLEAETAEPVAGWSWIEHYLQLEVDLAPVLASFPGDPPLQAAIAACRGLRLLRQDPWECLASFILSSTKQIVQIRQMVALLSERFGTPVTVPADRAPAWAFPTAAQLAAGTEADLRSCKLGFRAPYLLAAARQLVEGQWSFERIAALPLEEARSELMRLPGVGRKIADCVLLFALGFPRAFPIDVWVDRTLRRLYFPRRRVTRARLERFVATHFGPQAGYAQQYLFHHARLLSRSKPPTLSARR